MKSIKLLFALSLIISTSLKVASAQDSGSYPSSRLAIAGDGNFYGENSQGGLYGYGTVYRLTSQGTVQLVYSFNGTNGSGPGSGELLTKSMIASSDGNLYGTTQSGGAYNHGTIFYLTTNGVLTTIFSFNGTNSATPLYIIQASDGNLYGTTTNTIFKSTTNGALTTIASGHGFSSVTEGSDGNLYGTYADGTNPSTIFSLTKSGVLTILTNAPGVSYGGLVQANDGNFYGTIYGGSGGSGLVFKVTTGGALATLASFSGTGAVLPMAGLIQASDGILYGTTYGLTSYGNGSVYKITTSGTITLLVGLTGASNVNSTPSGLIQGSDGNLYGVTYYGGTGNIGSIFKTSTNGVLTTIYSFGSVPSSGSGQTDIPTMPVWGLLLLAGMIVVIVFNKDKYSKVL